MLSQLVTCIAPISVRKIGMLAQPVTRTGGVSVGIIKMIALTSLRRPRRAPKMKITRRARRKISILESNSYKGYICMNTNLYRGACAKQIRKLAQLVRNNPYGRYITRTENMSARTLKCVVS